jgi:chromosome partitioning protein
MAHVFAVVNQKGGVGKTTTAVNIASYLAMSGAKTLLVDLDPQGNATSGFGIARAGLRASCYDVLIDSKPLIDAIVPTKVVGLSILPATMDLAGADIQLIDRENREMALRTALEPARAYFDYVLIDAPPSLGLLTLNALVACDSILLPIQTEYYALEGISQLLKTVDLVKKSLNPQLEIGLVVLTMYDNRVRLAQQVVAEVRKFFGARVARAEIPRNVRLSEAPSHGVPIALYDPRSRGARAYQSVAMEVLQRGKTASR